MNETSDKDTFSLYAQEERVIHEAGQMVGKLQDVSKWVKHLARAYQKTYRELARLVRLSDRMQLDLQQANQRLADQTKELEVRNHFIRQVFGRYLSDDVVESLLNSQDAMKIGGEARMLTILLSDLRGFTSQCERLSAEKVVTVLNTYFEAMVEVISSCGGTIDEVRGDGILVFFGAPLNMDDHARQAVKCAIRMQRAMAEVNASLVKDKLPALEMGIGVNTGKVVVGNIGSTTRTKYGVVGQAVNAAARIESATVGGQVLVSDRCIEAAGSGVEVEELVELQAKGFSKPIRAYNLVGLVGDDSDEVPRKEQAMHECDLLVSYAHTQDKQFPTQEYAARITAISQSGALLQSPEEFERLTDLRLRLLRSDGSELVSDLYAKVISHGTRSAAPQVELRFTSYSPELATLVQGLG